VKRLVTLDHAVDSRRTEMPLYLDEVPDAEGCGRKQRRMKDQVMLHGLKHIIAADNSLFPKARVFGNSSVRCCGWVMNCRCRHRDVPTKILTNGY
jgi:hypothetical protein